MAEASAGAVGGAPLPPKRPTIIRPAPVKQFENNGSAEERVAPSRPPVPSHRPSVPPLPARGQDLSPSHHKHPHIQKINDGGPPQLPSKPLPDPKTNNRGSVKKRLEITVVGARPMSEVGFRSEGCTSPAIQDNPSFSQPDDDAPPAVPQRNASLQGMSIAPSIPNKPLPPPPSSKHNIPLRPSQPPKPALSTKPRKTNSEEGLLIDFSDEIQVQSSPPLIPLPDSSTCSPEAELTPAVPPENSLALPSKSPRPVPRSRSPAPPSRPPKSLNLPPAKPSVPQAKPRTTPDSVRGQNFSDNNTTDPAPVSEPTRPSRPTIIRPKTSAGPSGTDDSSRMGLPPPKPATPPSPSWKNAAQPSNPETATADPETEVEYAVIEKTVKKPQVLRKHPWEDDGSSKTPPDLPPKIMSPEAAPRPTVLPKPRTTVRSVGADKSSDESPSSDKSSITEANNNVKSGPPKPTKPTIIRPPPKPLRLHEIEGKANKASTDEFTKSSDKDDDVQVVSKTDDDVPPKPSKTEDDMSSSSSSAPPRPASRRPYSVIGAPVTRVEEPVPKSPAASKPPPPRPTSVCWPKQKPVEVKDGENAEPPVEASLPVSDKRPPRPKPPSPKNRSPSSSTEEAASTIKPSRPVGGPPRPTAPYTSSVERDKPTRPQPPRPIPPKVEKPAVPPMLPARPTPDHVLYHYILTYPHGIAEHDFTATKDDEISFKEGEVILLTERVDSQWLKGKVGDKVGVFPENFVNIIHPLHSEIPAGTNVTKLTKDLTKPNWSDEEEDKVDEATADVGNGPRCKARFDFEGEGEGDLTFEEDDIIKLKKHVGSDWLEGELNGKSGIFPVSFVEIIEDVPEDLEPEAADGLYTVKAVFDFEGDDDEEISFKKGDKIHVICEVNSEWLYGETGGKPGKFPASFVDYRPLELPTWDEYLALIEEHQKAKNKVVLFTCTALHDYESQQEGDLQFKAGSHIEVIEELGDWLKGCLDDKEGIFPKSFVEIENNAEGACADSIDGGKQAKALFDFTGEGEKELTFKEGDVIILGKLVPGAEEWCWGSIDGRSGMFPLSFVEAF